MLREQLAIQRTFLANQSTFLSFLRSSMYFLVAGLSVNKLVNGEEAVIFEYILFVISGLLLVVGIINYFRNRKKIKQSEIHIGDYKLKYEK
ncbi:DUF202 domain-containing protein [Moheibacter lacus]|uniref:DUF202 domain-containing protein n=1 Tax=Moheibacter lacus TaxID=2745851 RepID=A0A838ZSQ2_9FLAO|nr:DUF202 domain-containing protein [Moheibacter lacus]MBA5630001.1 DUF202 domain-containing protein [Moheibacter lacus]